MTTLTKLIPGLILLFALSGCSGGEDSQPAPAPAPPPEFSRADDPKAFFAAYWDDLSGERFLPQEIQKMYVGRTPLPQTLALMREHETMAFLEWYYDRDYLESLRQRDARELDKMDYQLDIMDVAREDAADVLLLADSAPLAQKTQLLKGAVGREWKRLDEETWQVTLTREGWGQRLQVVKRGDRWKLNPIAFRD